jgi:hypothetical protein
MASETNPIRVQTFSMSTCSYKAILALIVSFYCPDWL